MTQGQIFCNIDLAAPVINERMNKKKCKIKWKDEKKDNSVIIHIQVLLNSKYNCILKVTEIV